ncbi:MAG TPA: sugar phosphate nucleotidyltransferase [Anaerolineales bacterium]|nr:sugar phosphate nucleotidyltransferase [Anaerolineales bacterium]
MGENFYAVIMAGGGGTRLWPLSRQARPKQMLQLIDDHTLFQMAVRRLESIFPPEHILVVTNAQHSVELLKQVPQLSEANFLLEPQPRGTAAAIGLAAAFLHNQRPGSLMAVLTADHYIGNPAEFHRHLLAAAQLAQAGHLVTLGIEPLYPATQYGYIQKGDPLGVVDGFQAYQVRRFKEKPEAAEAQRMLASGDFSWNSGMFIWKTERIWEEFKQHLPDLFTALDQISQSWDKPGFDRVIKELWPRIAAQTIDYGIMEHARDVAVIPAKDLAWNDVGSWSSLFDVMHVDGDGNLILHGQHVGLDSHDSLVHSNAQERLIVTVGINDLVVVDTGDVLLICARDRSQDLRKIIAMLKEKGLQGYL